jgi:hypothetical protein
VATTFNEHRRSFAIAPDEHLDLNAFGFYSSALIKKYVKTASFRMAARRSLGWNWHDSPQRLATAAARGRESADAIELVYLRRHEFLLATQMVGCLLLIPTILKTDSARGFKIVDAVIGQIAKNIVLDVLRQSSTELRNFIVDSEHVSAMNLPKSFYGFGAYAMNAAGSMVDASVAYRTTLKVDGFLSDKYMVSEPIAFEAVRLLGPKTLLHLGVLR